MSFGWTRLQFVLVYAVVGSFLPYLPLVLKDRGVNEAGVGWILGLYGLVIAVMPMWTTYLADRNWSPRLLIAAGNLIAAVGAFILVHAQGFWSLLLGCMVMYAGFAPLVNLIDGTTFAAMAKVKSSGRIPPAYHTIRIFGSIGFMLPSISIYALLQWGGVDNAVSLWTAAVCALIAAGIALRLPGPQGTRQIELMEAPTLEAARRIFTGPALSVIGPLFLMFTAIAAFYTFYPDYLRNLGIGQQWVGLIVNIGVAAEIVLMFWSRPILAKLGIRGIVLLGGVSLAIRMALLAFIPNTHVAIWSQLLHAPIVMCLYILPPIYLNHLAGPAIRHSVQGLFGVLCFGGARLVGAIVSGYLADDTDLTTPFIFSTVVCILAVVWFALGFRDKQTCLAIRAAHRLDNPAPPTPTAEP